MPNKDCKKLLNLFWPGAMAFMVASARSSRLVKAMQPVTWGMLLHDGEPVADVAAIRWSRPWAVKRARGARL
jgi:hypothetical protein